mmetsp:Transcript_155085/g.270031  ORF Transcript_155085/g.270031 Transcript_155085/m.270031 type:complete len:422 (-) Transcript_155085:108-1373(-)
MTHFVCDPEIPCFALRIGSTFCNTFGFRCGSKLSIRDVSTFRLRLEISSLFSFHCQFGALAVGVYEGYLFRSVVALDIVTLHDHLHKRSGHFREAVSVESMIVDVSLLQRDIRWLALAELQANVLVLIVSLGPAVCVQHRVNGSRRGNLELNPRSFTLTFRCPHLACVFFWLAKVAIVCFGTIIIVVVLGARCARRACINSNCRNWDLSTSLFASKPTGGFLERFNVLLQLAHGILDFEVPCFAIRIGSAKCDALGFGGWHNFPIRDVSTHFGLVISSFFLFHFRTISVGIYEGDLFGSIVALVILGNNENLHECGGYFGEAIRVEGMIIQWSLFQCDLCWLASTEGQNNFFIFFISKGATVCVQHRVDDARLIKVQLDPRTLTLSFCCPGFPLVCFWLAKLTVKSVFAHKLFVVLGAGSA